MAERRALWPALAALAGIALTVSLGTWQLGRAAEKRDLKARFEARASEPAVQVPAVELPAADVELRRVEARGEFDPRHAIYLDNRIHRGAAGYHVVMPLRLGASERYVLVNRGWIARGPDRSVLPTVRTPRGLVNVTGVAVVPGRRILELSKEVIEGPIWQNLTIERYRQSVPIAIQPFVIRQDNDFDDGLVREWEAPDFGIDKHYGYAFQWYALAVTIAALFIILNVRRRSRATPPKP